jgi:hypothetical protein
MLKLKPEVMNLNKNYFSFERCRLLLTFAFILLFSAAGLSQPCGPLDVTIPEGIAPVFTPGNPTCTGYEYKFKVDPPTPGAYNLPGGGTLTWEIVNGPCGQVVNWEASNGVEIFIFIVKGGPDANIYYYDGTVTFDGNLHTPVGPSGDYYGVSHIEICYNYVPIDPDPECVIEVNKHVTCFGFINGIFTVSIIDGTPPFQIRLLEAGTPPVEILPWFSPDNERSHTFTGYAAGTYIVEVQDSEVPPRLTACEVTLTQPDELTCEIVKTDVTCYEGNDGTATVSVTGGVGPFTYLWEDEDGNTVGTLQTVTGLSAGIYTVTVTDTYTGMGMGGAMVESLDFARAVIQECFVTCEVEILEPAELVCAIEDVEHVSCYGEADGQATVVASGGTPPYTYLWSDGQTTAIASGLSAGTYTVTVTDDNDCEVECEVIITEPDELACEIIDVEHVLCYGEATGEATVVASGGTPPYTYLWSDGQTTATATGLSAGNIYSDSYR